MYSPYPHGEHLSDFFDQARRLYSEMDQDYEKAAGASGFACNGCEENCCRTLFYHHTYLEYTLLQSGFNKLPRARQRIIVERATAYVRSVTKSGVTGEQVICPLNEEGRCILYPVRPMICRLHGIPNRFTPPGHPQRLGPGCKAFYQQCGQREEHRLDRTPHYLKLARLEAQLKQQSGLNQKIKLTVAEMLLKKPTGDIAEFLSSAPSQPSADIDHETD